MLGRAPCHVPILSFTLSTPSSQNNTHLGSYSVTRKLIWLLYSSLPKVPSVPETQEINVQIPREDHI